MASCTLSRNESESRRLSLFSSIFDAAAKLTASDAAIVAGETLKAVNIKIPILDRRRL
jgi:hypothetical protein